MYKFRFELVFILLLSILEVSEVNSQTKDFIAGVFVNTNGMKIEGYDDIFWQSSRGRVWGALGISCGVNIKRDITKKSYLAAEIGYIQKGSIYEYQNQYAIRDLDLIRLNYIEVPILWGYEFYINDKDFYFETGLGIAKLFSSKSKINNLAYKSYVPDVQYFQDLDFSWPGSFKFPLNRKGKQNILFGARFSYSLVTIHEHYNLRNMLYGIQFDYILGKKKT